MGGRVRVGLAVAQAVVPQWTVALAQALEASSEVELTVFLATDSDASATVTRRSGLRLWNAYRTIDRHLQRAICRSSPDPRVMVDLEEAGFEVVVGRPRDTALIVAAVDQSVATRLAAEIRCPVWCFDHDGHRPWAEASSGYAPVLAAEESTQCTLFSVSGDRQRGDTLRRALFSTHPLFGAENRVQLLWKSIPLVIQQVEAFAAGGVYAAPLAPGVARTAKRAPGALGLLVLLARHAVRSAAFSLRRVFWRGQWFIVQGQPSSETCPPEDTLSCFRALADIVPPRDRFWADPHLLSGSDETLVLVEEYPFASRRGHIALLRLNDHGALIEARPVLQRADCHLSYPATFTVDGELYMVPESRQLRRVDAYRCVEYPWRWEFDRTLIDGLYACDSSLVEFDGRWWLFATVSEHAWLTPRDTLHVFVADHPLAGDWRPHKGNPVVCDVHRSRPAGQPFVVQGRLFRPSQDCSSGYGAGMRLHEVVSLTEDVYDEREVSSLRPVRDRGMVASHTLAWSEHAAIVDGMRWQPRWARSRRDSSRIRSIKPRS